MLEVVTGVPVLAAFVVEATSSNTSDRRKAVLGWRSSYLLLTVKYDLCS